MGEFFRGWRRKIGCATLVIACVFMAGWTRSYFTHDAIDLESSNGTWIQFGSTDGDLIWMSAVSAILGLSAREAAMAVGLPFDEENVVTTNGLSTTTQTSRLVTVKYIVPYWTVVLPLTVISAFLLLSKPRPSNQNKIAEPSQTKERES